MMAGAIIHDSEELIAALRATEHAASEMNPTVLKNLSSSLNIVKDVTPAVAFLHIQAALGSLGKSLDDLSAEFKALLNTPGDLEKLSKGLEDAVVIAAREEEASLAAQKAALTEGKTGAQTQDMTGVSETGPEAQAAAQRSYVGKIIADNPYKTTMATISVLGTAGLIAYGLAAYTATNGKRFNITKVEKNSDGKFVVTFVPAPYPGDGPTVGWKIINTDTIEFNGTNFNDESKGKSYAISDIKLGNPNTLIVPDMNLITGWNSSPGGTLGYFIVWTSFTGQFRNAFKKAAAGVAGLIKDALTPFVDAGKGFFCELIPWICNLDIGWIIAIVVGLILLCVSSSVAISMADKKK